MRARSVLPLAALALCAGLGARAAWLQFNAPTRLGPRGGPMARVGAVGPLKAGLLTGMAVTPEAMVKRDTLAPVATLTWAQKADLLKAVGLQAPAQPPTGATTPFILTVSTPVVAGRGWVALNQVEWAEPDMGRWANFGAGDMGFIVYCNGNPSVTRYMVDFTVLTYPNQNFGFQIYSPLTTGVYSDKAVAGLQHVTTIITLPGNKPIANDYRLCSLVADTSKARYELRQIEITPL